jgi:hypothetical protein
MTVAALMEDGLELHREIRRIPSGDTCIEVTGQIHKLSSGHISSPLRKCGDRPMDARVARLSELPICGRELRARQGQAAPTGEFSCLCGESRRQGARP